MPPFEPGGSIYDISPLLEGKKNHDASRVQTTSSI
jgi:hypothetical protein